MELSELFETWRSAPARFSDERLEIQGHAVMEQWEEPYMAALAAIACSRAGRVLEVGFGLGIAASHIQAYEIAEHIVIEANQNVYERLQAFARHTRVPMRVLFGFWQEVARTLPDESVSGILFDTYPLIPEESHRNHFPFLPEAHRLLVEGGVLTYYSDETHDFSAEHREALQSAGFRTIEKRVCVVNPPAECTYWKHNTIVAPIIIK
jgi:guanidinoacetate N-methyltransferase